MCVFLRLFLGMKFFRLICFFSFVLMFTSCEEDFVLVKKDFTSQLVVNSIFKPDQKWIVHVSTSRNILDPNSQIKNIENADVVIIEKKSGYKIYLEHKGDGIYSTDYYPPQIDKTYELVIEVPGYKTVKAASKVPKNANIVNIMKDVVSERVSTVNFQVKDVTKQYLIWNFITVKGKTGNPESEFTGIPKSFIYSFMDYNRSLASFTLNGSDVYTSDGTFSSSVVDGKEDDTSDENPNETDAPNVNDTDEFKNYLRVVTASSDLYNYYKSVERFLSAGNHNSSFSNSPEIYTNIENGIGVFAGYTEQYTEIE